MFGNDRPLRKAALSSPPDPRSRLQRMAESLDTLVADSDRATAADELRRHYDSGRLTLDEFESRLGEVHAARTRGDLEQAFRQLPRSEPPASLRMRDLRWSSLALQYGLCNLVCILVWLFSELKAASGPSGSSSGRWLCISAASAADPAGASCRRLASGTGTPSLARRDSDAQPGRAAWALVRLNSPDSCRPQPESLPEPLRLGRCSSCCVA